jgi:capsular polysaccharide transport system ATP-binding protein
VGADAVLPGDVALPHAPCRAGRRGVRRACLELVNLTKYYPTPGAALRLSQPQLPLPGGREHRPDGRNGAGKSTLMRIIAGVEVPNQGHVRTDKTMSWRVGLGAFRARCPRGTTCVSSAGCSAPVRKTRAKVRYVEEFAEIGKFFDMPMKTCPRACAAGSPSVSAWPSSSTTT